MKKWVCEVCSYVHEGDNPPDVCPVCGASKDKLKELE
jgi:rubrerythrin